MANSRDIKRIVENFKKEEKNKKIDFHIEGTELSKKELFDKGLFSSNVFEEEIKQEYFTKLGKDSTLKISGVGILHILVEEDINLELIFDSNFFSNLSIKILVLENRHLNLIDFTDSKNLYKNVEIYLEKNAVLRQSQFILNSETSFSNVILNENSSYDLKAVYFGNDSKNYIVNSAIHIGKFSDSNLDINGLAQNNSYVINDAKVRILKDASKSTGHQKMKNLILDKASKIQSEPILEIETNDVNCSHSSSISQISEDVLFFMNSRGISKKEAISIISKSYFDIVIDAISDKDLNKKYEEYFENFQF